MLSVNRLDRYKRIPRPADRGGQKRARAEDRGIVGDGPDRGRLEEARLRPQRARSSSSGSGRRRRGSLTSTPAASPFTTRPWTRTTELVPVRESFLSAKPVVTTLDAGGPLEVVHDRETGVVVAPEPAALAEGLPAYLAGHLGEARRLGEAAQGPRREDHLGRLPSRPCSWMKVAYYSPLPPRTRGSPITQAAPARPSASGSTRSSSPRPGKTRAPSADISPLPDRERPRRARLDRRCAPRASRRRRPPRASCCTTWTRRDHDRPRRTAAPTWTRWSATTASPAGCSGLGVLDNLLPLIWETQPGALSAHRHRPRPRDAA